uniref:PDZ domain-containing protein n=1 Tax=Glossina morsitans morsitans TaxID=37546 RepID=A0A1B0FKB8_GLOMM
MTLGDRAMSPAQSEDSGLAPERGTTYATITLPRDNTTNIGITLAERNELSYPPVIAALSALGHAADFLAPGDRLHQIDGISTIGLTNQHVMNMLSGSGSTDRPTVVEIEYSLLEYSSLCVTTKLAQITVERESGCLGLTLRGGADYPLIVTHVRPHGPVYKTGRIKPGDRLLRVDNVSLIGKTLAEAQQIIKCGVHISGYTNLTIEYDVSIIQSIELSMGPLLIEIERPMNDKLGLVLCNYTSALALTEHTSKFDEVNQAGAYIASILPASIADRCGALSVGDQVLSIDDINIENAAYTPDEVMTLLDTNTGRGYTQMQIMPAHALARRGHTTLGSPKCGFNTLDSRKSRQRQRFARKSSFPLENANGLVGGSGTTNSTASAAGSSGSVPSSSASGSSLGVSTNTLGLGTGTLPHHSNMGICRAETFPVLLDCSMGSGLVLGQQSACGRAVTINHIITDSVSDRCGCIQKGDRIVAINKMYNLEVQAMRELLGDVGTRPSHNPANWLELEIEFDMPDTVVPSSGVFNVKVVRSGKAGLGLSVNGSSHGGFVIADVKPGSPAHRTGSLRSGDILLAVDNHPIQHFSVDTLLKEGTTSDFTTLTVKRVMLPDFLFDTQQKLQAPIYSNCLTSPTSEHDLYSSSYVTSKYAEIKYNDCLSSKSNTPQPEYYRGPTLNENALMSVQIRRHLGGSNWSGTIGRSLANQNTQSLTTELPEDENNYHDFVRYELDRYNSVDSGNLPPPMGNKLYGSNNSPSSKNNANCLHQVIFTVRLEPKGGLLGITLAGSEDVSKAITISGLVEGGIAYKNGQVQVGDQLLAINNELIQSLPLSHATNLLQNIEDVVDLKLLRSHDTTNNFTSGGTLYESETNILSQPQAIYAKVQRRPRSPSMNTENSSTSGKQEKQKIFPVTLYKDKVYDDYGFSVSDGLYERGVFVNRIRSGGPADKCGLLKPFDRIMQVNDMKTQDFDCCLTVPLIAAAGDKIELIIQRTD